MREALLTENITSMKNCTTLIYPNFGKKMFVFYPNFVFLGITFEPEMLESQSKAQKTQIIA